MHHTPRLSVTLAYFTVALGLLLVCSVKLAKCQWVAGKLSSSCRPHCVFLLQITGLGYLGMYSSAGCFLVKGIQHARNKRIPQHQLNMVRLVGLSWGVSPLGRILTVTPPIIWFSGPWNNAAVVCLSWPLGIWVAEKYLLGCAATVH